MAYSRSELLQVVCAIAGRPSGCPGGWASADGVVEEAAALLAEMDHRWEVYSEARAAAQNGRSRASPRCTRATVAGTPHGVPLAVQSQTGRSAGSVAHEKTGETLGKPIGAGDGGLY